MIFEFIIDLFLAPFSLLVAGLPTFSPADMLLYQPHSPSTVYMPETVNALSSQNALFYMFEFCATFNTFVPFDQFLLIMFLLITAYGSILGWHVVKNIIAFIRGCGFTGLGV